MTLQTVSIRENIVGLPNAYVTEDESRKLLNVAHVKFSEKLKKFKEKFNFEKTKNLLDNEKKFSKFKYDVDGILAVLEKDLIASFNKEDSFCEKLKEKEKLLDQLQEIRLSNVEVSHESRKKIDEFEEKTKEFLKKYEDTGRLNNHLNTIIKKNDKKRADFIKKIHQDTLFNRSLSSAIKKDCFDIKQVNVVKIKNCYYTPIASLSIENKNIYELIVDRFLLKNNIESLDVEFFEKIISILKNNDELAIHAKSVLLFKSRLPFISYAFSFLVLLFLLTRKLPLHFSFLIASILTLLVEKIKTYCFDFMFSDMLNNVKQLPFFERTQSIILEKYNDFKKINIDDDFSQGLKRFKLSTGLLHQKFGETITLPSELDILSYKKIRDSFEGLTKKIDSLNDQKKQILSAHNFNIGNLNLIDEKVNLTKSEIQSINHSIDQQTKITLDKRKSFEFLSKSLADLFHELNNQLEDHDKIEPETSAEFDSIYTEYQNLIADIEKRVVSKANLTQWFLGRMTPQCYERLMHRHVGISEDNLKQRVHTGCFQDSMGENQSSAPVPVASTYDDVPSLVKAVDDVYQHVCVNTWKSVPESQQETSTRFTHNYNVGFQHNGVSKSECWKSRVDLIKNNIDQWLISHMYCTT